jgi:lipopolysaccharide export system protein LptA
LPKILPLRKFLIIFIVFTVFQGISQEKDIEYISDRTSINEEVYPGAFIFNKIDNQVYFIHEGIELWCDQALFYKNENFFKAYGNVRMKQGDTVNMKSAYAEYNGKTQFAFASKDVVLTTPSNRLETDSLFFDRIAQKAFYRTGGKVTDTSSTITSVRGIYEMKKDKYAFRQNVKVNSPDYVIDTNILDYYTNNGYAYLYEPSTVTTESGKVYCERGFFDSRNKLGYFIKNARVDYEQRIMYGDSIFFDQNKNFASASNNIRIFDTINKTKVIGHYAEVYKAKDSVIITKNPLASTFEENDSIHIASDTMMITGKPEQRIIRSYPDARLFKSDMSGKSDSIHSSQLTGYTRLIGKPVLWSSNGQITGDTILLISDVKTEQLDSLRVYENSFLVQQDSIEGFNQVKGKELYGLFEKNELVEANFIKNAETVYYTRNDFCDLIGIDKTTSSSIKLILEDKQVKDVYYYDDVPGKTYPEDELPPNARRLKGMVWRGDEQIRSKQDLLTDRPVYTLPEIRGLKYTKEPDSIAEPFYKLEDLNTKSNLYKDKENSDLKLKPNITPLQNPVRVDTNKVKTSKPRNLKLKKND